MRAEQVSRAGASGNFSSARVAACTCFYGRNGLCLNQTRLSACRYQEKRCYSGGWDPTCLPGLSASAWQVWECANVRGTAAREAAEDPSGRGALERQRGCTWSGGDEERIRKVCSAGVLFWVTHSPCFALPLPSCIALPARTCPSRPPQAVQGPHGAPP